MWKGGEETQDQQPGGKELDEFLQSEPSFVLQILQKTVLHPLCLKYPTALQYRRLFLSELIKKHEHTGADPLDVLYNALGDVLNTEENTVCYKSYFLPSGDTVTLSESLAIISEGTTGLVTWEAALTLAEWALQSLDILKHRTILELGSGVGLTGLAICKSCSPKKYLFSDHHPRVLQQVAKNIHLNGYYLDEEHDSQHIGQSVKAAEHGISPENIKISVVDLDWQSVTEKQLSHFQAEVDVVIAADIVYDPGTIIILSKFLNQLLSCIKGGRTLEVYIASTIRNHETYTFFKVTLNGSGLSWQVVPGPKNTLFSQDVNFSVEILKITLQQTKSSTILGSYRAVKRLVMEPVKICLFPMILCPDGRSQGGEIPL
uniref:FAM86 N-terminal domain-containing protein n=1 Tax=Leptobrachium leishanense TaxID=445787 RepID=A0A8C5WI78_9ANUR